MVSTGLHATSTKKFVIVLYDSPELLPEHASASHRPAWLRRPRSTPPGLLTAPTPRTSMPWFSAIIVVLALLAHILAFDCYIASIIRPLDDMLEVPVHVRG
jgi:hypothetical protein